MKKFTNCYQLQKTLRFELIPIGETRTNIEASGILEGDEKKANDYIEVKKLIDDYHKYFIKTCLDKAELIIDSEGKLNSLYNPQNETFDRFKSKRSFS